MPRLFLLFSLLILSTILVVALIWLTDWPLGVPGEWTWDRISRSEPWYFTAIPSMVAASIYMTFVWLAAPRVSQSSRIVTALRLGGLAIAGFAWLCVVQEGAPRANQLSKAGYVLYFRGPSGYFSQARYDISDLPEFLSNYNRLMSQGEVLHIGTHPPGLIVLLRGLINLCKDSPALTQFLIQSQPPSVVDAFNDIAGSASAREPFRKADRATLWLAFLLVQLSVSVMVIPLYALLRRFHPQRVAWLAVSFWPVVPAVAIFLPKSDVLFAGMSVWLGWLWLEGVRKDRRLIGRILFCGAAGALFWVGLTLSLAILPIGFLLAIATFGQFREQPSLESSRVTRPSLPELGFSILIAAVVFLSLCGVVWWNWKLNLFETWRWNYLNHAAFYKLYSRTYSKWLAINPLEFAIVVGLPLVILAVKGFGAGGLLTRRPGTSLSWALVLTWGILWISGKNMGEAARLWTFLMPWFLFPAANALSAFEQNEPRERNELQFRLWGVALACQFTVNIALVIRVVGFPLPFPVDA